VLVKKSPKMLPNLFLSKLVRIFFREKSYPKNLGYFNFFKSQSV
jgi:hypothetical protein